MSTMAARASMVSRTLTEKNATAVIPDKSGHDTKTTSNAVFDNYVV